MKYRGDMTRQGQNFFKKKITKHKDYATVHGPQKKKCLTRAQIPGYSLFVWRTLVKVLNCYVFYSKTVGVRLFIIGT